MEFNDFLAALTQFQSEGNDIAPLVTAAQGLLDTGKTPLGLNQWKLSDKPRMEEFNEDNRIIDQELRELHENKADIKCPNIHRIQTAEGITGNAYFYQTQENIVHIEGVFYKEDNSSFGPHCLLFTLPEGYRPQLAKTVIPITVESNPSGVRAVAWLHLYKDGNGYFMSTQGMDATKVHVCNCHASFLVS